MEGKKSIRTGREEGRERLKNSRRKRGKVGEERKERTEVDA